MTPPPDPYENTPIQGEHFPADRAAPGCRARRSSRRSRARWCSSARSTAGRCARRAPSPGCAPAGSRSATSPSRALDGALDKAADGYLDSRVALAFGKDERVVKRRDLGFVVDRAAARELDQGAGKSGNPLADVALRSRARRGKVDLALPVDVDRKKALEFLTELKDDVDRAPVGRAPRSRASRHRQGEAGLPLARLRLDGRRRVRGALGRLARRARGGPVVAEGQERGLSRTSTSRRCSATGRRTIPRVGPDTDRTYNLKVGADKLNGHILKPHEVFSFNEVVGDRTEKEGYRVAPVIQGGELIDGLAGGMCQIASTLHAAAFFAGLDIVSSTPHSRPSAYIPMGLDSTVVYPSTDLKLRNPYDFPVVMHYQVNQGAVKVELLGKERPYKVVFEREIKAETPFGTDTRGDAEAPSGQRYMHPGRLSGLHARCGGATSSRRTSCRAGAGPEPLAEALDKSHIKPVRRKSSGRCTIRRRRSSSRSARGRRRSSRSPSRRRTTSRRSTRTTSRSSSS